MAVKVQHPLVKAYSTIDMKSMEVLQNHFTISLFHFYTFFFFFSQILVNLASWIFPELKLEWLVKETKKNLPCELNFIMEGENAEKTSGLMKHLPWLHVLSFTISIELISKLRSVPPHFYRYRKYIGISLLQEF